MRESEIRIMQQQNAARSGLILSQFQFLKTRQQAFEMVFKASSLFDRVLWLFRPFSFVEAVDAVHLSLLKEEKARVDAAVEKAKEESRKPKLTIVGANGAIHG